MALKALGLAVRNRRLDLSLSQEELGNSAELHRTYITDIEGGTRNLSFLTLLRIAGALTCTLSELLTEAETLGSSNLSSKEKPEIKQPQI